MSLDTFERVELLFGPSPVHRLERLSEHLGGRVQIWAKREDCNSGLAYGGNKVRKLEYLAAEAITTGCDTLVSIGGVQSNHTRQVAAVAARLSTSAFGQAGSRRASRSKAEAASPTPIPAGASDHPLGGLGFARWADEVAEQEHALGVFFDTIVVCSVTGSTQAGMLAGFATQGRPRRVLGIDGSATVQQTHAQISRIAQRTAQAIGLSRELRDDEVVLLDGWHAGRYGIPDTKTLEAIQLCARLEGMLTDPVYEGKSMAALIDLIRSGEIAPGSTVLYAHLGGQPALDAYSAAF